jgi:hypothetical protein
MEWECYRMGMDGTGIFHNENEWNGNDTFCYIMMQNG